MASIRANWICENGLTVRASSRASTTARASRFCPRLGDTLVRMKRRSSGTVGAVLSIELIHSGMEHTRQIEWRSGFKSLFQTVCQGIRLEWLSEHTHRTDGSSSCFQPRLFMRGYHDHGQPGAMSQESPL